jgi:hypothetical protein
VLIWCYIDVVCETMSIITIFYCYISLKLTKNNNYVYFIFSALARELNEPSRADSVARYLNEPNRADSLA